MKTIKSFFRHSISAKLILLILTVSLIPLAIIGYLSIKTSYDTLEESQFKQLEAVGGFKTMKITNFLNNRFTELEVLTKSGDAMAGFQKLNKYHNDLNLGTGDEFITSGKQYEEIYKEINPFFKTFTNSFNFNDLFLISASHGHVMYSTQRRSDLGTNLSDGPLKNSGLAEAWKSVIRTKKPMLIDFSIYQPVNKPVAFIAAPILDKNNEVLAVFAIELNTEEIDEIMAEKSGMGETGETYLVGDDYYLRSDLRIKKNGILNTKVETESVKLGLEDKRGVHIINDYRGIPVLSYYSPIELHEEFKAEFDWVVISEINTDEVFKSATFLKNQIIIIAIIIAIIVSIIAYLFSRVLTNPIKKITKSAKAAALGDLNQDFNIRLQDEIGILANAFRTMQENIRTKAEQARQIADGNLTLEVEVLSDKDEMGISFQTMAQNLREHINNISEVVATLTSSNSQLTSMISQLSASSSETATTVNEISTTIEEVKQTAEVSTQKAKNVSDTAIKSVKISENGIKATEDSLEGMLHIQEQVKKIADTIIKLSEQSQTIGEITESVNDLAEQSNLLAVNASIEAVKAGEYGKGFGVVAQEIRVLADQSKQSTKQIKEILNDVQKAVSSAVMATEQGGKAVDQGMELSESAGDSISMLADSISEASQASTQIAASSQQQLTGMEQLAAAMDNIKLAASQNSAGTKQAEEAVGSLKSIVDELKILIGKYKLK